MSKERAQLRKEANGIETIMQIGRGGMEEASVRQIDEALTARELIKIRVLETCSESVREVAEAAATATNSECVQVIGSRFILWRKRPEKPVQPVSAMSPVSAVKTVRKPGESSTRKPNRQIRTQRAIPAGKSGNTGKSAVRKPTKSGRK